MHLTIDAVIVTHGSNGALRKCIESLTGADGIIVIVNGVRADTVEYLQNAAKHIAGLEYHVFDSPVPKSAARNFGVERSRADIVYFIDDDSYAAPGALIALREKFAQYPDASAIGGPNLTPPDSPVFQRLSGRLLASYFVSGGMSKRYFAASESDAPCGDSSLILCNLAFRKKCFEGRSPGFDERLHYNEENLLLARLARDGCKFIYSPELRVYHYRRKDIAGFARQVYGSGYGRAGMTLIMPESLSLTHIMPSALVIYAASFRLFGDPKLFSIPLLMYLAAAFWNAARIAVLGTERFLHIFTMVLITLTAHVSYGAGFLVGLIRAVRWKK